MRGSLLLLTRILAAASAPSADDPFALRGVPLPLAPNCPSVEYNRKFGPQRVDHIHSCKDGPPPRRLGRLCGEASWHRALTIATENFGAAAEATAKVYVAPGARVTGRGDAAVATSP